MIAYLILAHTDPAQLERLANAIDHRAHSFIHIDAKSPLAPFEALTLPRSSTLLRERVSANWAGISIIDATLLLMKAALAHPERFSHLVLLSGADYPIKPPDRIYATITQDPEHEFIRYFDMRNSHEFYRRHIEEKWFKEPWWKSSHKWPALVDKGCRYLANRLRLPNRWNREIVPYFGSQWWALTPGCCQYIVDYVEANPSFYSINRRTFSPDEHFIHTIVGNSPFASKADDVIPFEGLRTWHKTTNIHLIDESLSKWYTLDDWQEIAASDRLFVRKVSTLKSSELIEAIDRRILKCAYESAGI